MLSTSVITDPTRLRALRPEWEALAARSADSELPLHPTWLLTWWDVFGGEGRRSLRSLVFHDGDRLVGLAPLLGRRHVHRPGIPFRRIEMLGTGEDSADETCGDYLGILAERGREQDVTAAFAQAIISNAGGAWDELVLSSMSGESPIPKLLAQAFEARGLASELEEWTSCPYVPLPKSWDAYLGALKQTKRSQLKKALRACESWAGGEPTIVRVRRRDDIAEAKRVLEKLHKQRWTSDGSDGVFASDRFRAFHDRLMPELLDANALDLGWMSVRGEPMAAFYNFRWNGKVSFYQTGRRLDIPDEVRIGITMHAYLIRSAIEEGLREYDFLAGVSQYKMGLALATRPLVKLRVARPSVLERARVASEQGIDLAKKARDWARARELPAQTPPRIRSLVDKLRGRQPS
jgi:CelD/BcsL family acetyltransferase involved in cellulose biosynthesis